MKFDSKSNSILYSIQFNFYLILRNEQWIFSLSFSRKSGNMTEKGFADFVAGMNSGVTELNLGSVRRL